MLAVATLCGALTSVRASGHEAGCALPPNIRPVVQINGFGTGILFDSANGFIPAFPDLNERADDDGLGFFGNITADLSGSLEWNAANLTQEKSPIGPEASPEDALPGLVGPSRQKLDLVRLVRMTICTSWCAYVHRSTIYVSSSSWQLTSSCVCLIVVRETSLQKLVALSMFAAR